MPLPYIRNLKTLIFFSSWSVKSYNQSFNNYSFGSLTPFVLKHITSITIFYLSIIIPISFAVVMYISYCLLNG